MTEAYVSWVESVIPRAQQRGHMQFLSEQADALDAALQRGDTFTARRHLRAIQQTARKAQGI